MPPANTISRLGPLINAAKEPPNKMAATNKAIAPAQNTYLMDLYLAGLTWLIGSIAQKLEFCFR